MKSVSGAGWKHEFIEESEQDLVQIRNFLLTAARERGEPLDRATATARSRLLRIVAAARALTRAPYQGTLCPELGPNIRRVTKDRAIFYFDLIEDRHLVRILAIFFGGQDHDALILARLLSPEP